MIRQHDPTLRSAPMSHGAAGLLVADDGTAREVGTWAYFRV
jgi:hypothetical protein